MFVGYSVWLASLGILFLSGRMGSAFDRRPVISPAVIEDRCKVCPSYCDESGLKHEPVDCEISTSISFCCNFGLRLDCCTNETLKITNDIKDGFHCPSATTATYNRTVLFVCVVVGLTCFVIVIALFVYQKVRIKRRATNTNAERRSRRSSNASCSSQGSISSTALHHLHPQARDSVTIGPVQQPTVFVTTNLDDTYRMGDDLVTYRMGDDLVLRVLQAVQTANTDSLFVIQSTVYPPPYTDDTPPPYTEIFPS